MQAALRTEAKRLLAQGKVKAVLGYKTGSFPFYCQPFFAKTPRQADELIFNSLSINNLTRYLPGVEKPVAVVLKACEVNSLIQLIREKQLKREDVYLLGVACPGMLEPKNLEKDSRFALEEIKELEGLKVKTQKGEFLLSGLLNKCKCCENRIPAVYDFLCGEEQKGEKAAKIEPELENLEKLSPPERLAFWQEYFSRCIRCNACRQVCPLCYCEECILDRDNPRWVSAKNSPEEVFNYQMVRFYHLAGRCTSCGECERVCPVKIPLSLIYKKLAKSLNELYHYQPGIDPEIKPPLLTYQPGDREVESIFLKEDNKSGS